MNFQQSIASGFINYFNFEGRASRSEFWYFTLFQFLVSVPIMLIFGIDSPLLTLFDLVLFIPNLSISVRRLHDIDKSGWNILWQLIPIFGLIYLIILYCRESSISNRN